MEDKIKVNESRDKLAEEIDRLESTSYGAAVKPSLPQTTLKELEYSAPDDNQLKSAAEAELASYRSDTEKSLRQKSEAEWAELMAKRAAYDNGKRTADKELEQKYIAAARAIDNDTIKRGLARSSVAAVERGALEREYLGKSADVAREYSAAISGLESDIAAVNRKLQDALNDFNLTYAAKLTQKLNELKQERDKKITEVTKYNNEVKKDQAKLDGDRLKTESSLYSDALRQEQTENSLDGLPAERRDELYKAVYQKMDEFLGSLSPQQALLEIRNHSMYRKHLSNYYYYRLYDKYGREDRL